MSCFEMSVSIETVLPNKTLKHSIILQVSGQRTVEKLQPIAWALVEVDERP